MGCGRPVFVIAEIGVNHNGSIKLAKKMIDQAAKAGADAVKFQSFKTDSIITRDAPSARYHLRATGGKESWFELLKRLELKEESHLELLRYCKNKGVVFLSTAYDQESADFLDKIGVCAIKISSTDLNNIPLLKCVAAYGKPVILSTGMSTMNEVRESVGAILSKGNKKLILMQCTANYPPDVKDASLNVIEAFRDKFNMLVGYSDHLVSAQAAVAAVAKGACVYEAHFTLDNNLPGPDHKSSATPAVLSRIVRDIRITERLLGSFEKRVTASEKETRKKLRRSIVANRNIKAGVIIAKNDIAVKRPGTGLPPKYYFLLMGKIAKRDIKKDSLINLRDVR